MTESTTKNIFNTFINSTSYDLRPKEKNVWISFIKQ